MDERPKHCECCGKAEAEHDWLLSEYSGWRHDIGESDWLCPDCYENAATEE